MFDDLIKSVLELGSSREFRDAMKVARCIDPSEWIRSSPIRNSNVWYNHEASGIALCREHSEIGFLHHAKIIDYQFSFKEGEKLFDAVHGRSEAVRANLRRQLMEFAADLPPKFDTGELRSVRLLPRDEADQAFHTHFCSTGLNMYYSKDTLTVLEAQSAPYTILAYYDRHPRWLGSAVLVVLGEPFQQDPEYMKMTGEVAEAIVTKLSLLAEIRKVPNQ